MLPVSATEFAFNTASPKLNQLVTALCREMVRGVIVHGAVALAFAFGARRQWRTRQTGERARLPRLIVVVIVVVIIVMIVVVVIIVMIMVVIIIVMIEVVAVGDNDTV